MDPLRTRKWCPGHLVELDQADEFDHHVGGEPCPNQVACPACGTPLLPLLTLDARDPRLRLEDSGLTRIPLLYCLYCAVEGDPQIVYQLLDDGRINPLWQAPDPSELDDPIDQRDLYNDEFEYPYRGFIPDVFPKRSIRLHSMPIRLQEIFDQINSGQTTTEEEDEEGLSILGDFHGWGDEPGLRILAEINQVGGRSLHIQGGYDPTCPICHRPDAPSHMYFLASLCSLASLFGIGPEEVDFDQGELPNPLNSTQVIFFICPACRSVEGQYFTT